MVADYRAAGHAVPIEERPTGNTIRISDVRVDLGLWARYGARAALGAVSLLGWSEEWTSTATAARLRSWAFNDHPLAVDGSPLRTLPRRPPRWLKSITGEAQHRAIFYPAQSPEATASLLHIVLFGQDWFGIMVDSEGLGSKARTAWAMEVGGPPVMSDYADIADEAFDAAVAQRFTLNS